MTPLQANLKRLTKGIPLKPLSEQAGVPLHWLKRVMGSGLTKPNKKGLENLSKLSKVLGVDAKILLGEDVLLALMKEVEQLKQQLKIERQYVQIARDGWDEAKVELKKLQEENHRKKMVEIKEKFPSLELE